MDSQIFQTAAAVFGILISVLGFCIAWWVNNIWSTLKAQQEQMGALSLKLAENYPTRSELQNSMDRLKQSVDKLFDKLDEIQKDVRRGS